MSHDMTQADKERLIRALQQDDALRETVRNLLLGEELLTLPGNFARLVDTVQDLAEFVRQHIQEQRVFNAKVDDFIDDQKQFNAKVDDFIDDQKQFNAKVDDFIDKVEDFMTDQQAFNQRTEDTLGILKGNAARALLRDHHETILDLLGLDFARTLARDDLTRMVRNSGRATEIPFGDRRSFYAADLVIEGIDATGNAHYVAAEASFTADSRDTHRAIRNAAFLHEFTGYSVTAVVASVNNDYAVQEMVDSGQVQWLQLDEREMQPA